jgi:hypothetical protein
VFYTRAQTYAAKKDYEREIHDYTDVISRDTGNIAAYAGSHQCCDGTKGSGRLNLRLRRTWKSDGPLLADAMVALTA